MKRTVTLLFLLVPVFLPAQNYIPFVKSDAVWKNISWTSTLPIGSADYYSNMFFIDNDTTFKGKDYRFLYSSQYDSLIFIKNTSTAEFIREDSTKKIFIIPRGSNGILDSAEFLLYDFGVLAGDTVAFNNAWLHVDKPELHVLDTIDTIFISGIPRKQFTFLNGRIWIEGIGSLEYGFRGPYINPFESGEFLGCYYDSSIYWVSDRAKSCKTVGMENLSAGLTNKITLYPNPTSDNVHFNNLEPDITYRLYNTHGKLLSKGDFISKNFIDLTGHSKGLFLVTLSHKEKRIADFKIIKQ